MMRLTVAALGALILAFPAAAQTAEVRIGTRTTLALAREKATELATTAEPVTSPFEEAVVKQIEGPDYLAASGTNSVSVDAANVPAPDPIVPSKLSFKLVAVSGGKNTLLVIDNGYDQALAYQATMHVGGDAVKTGVCTVGPRQHGFEHWPHPIDSITVSALRFEPWTDTSQPRCE